MSSLFDYRLVARVFEIGKGIVGSSEIVWMWWVVLSIEFPQSPVCTLRFAILEAS